MIKSILNIKINNFLSKAIYKQIFVKVISLNKDLT